MSAAPPRLEALTGARGIAAWLVVFYHLRLSLRDLLPEGAIAALGKGYLAVDFFFMLSGFVLWLNHADAMARLDAARVARFWWRRVARIWPLHLLVLAGFVALAALLALTGRNTSDYPPAELPLHLLLVQNWGFTRALAWNHPAWSISAELAAYLLFPLLALSARWQAGTGALLGLATLLLGGIWAWFAFHGESRLGADITGLGLGRCLIEFALGTVAARLWRGWRGQGGRGGRIAAALALAAIVVAGLGIALGWAETAFVPAALLATLLALSLAGGRCEGLLGRGPVLWLGEVSYATYLAHFGLFIAFKLVFVGPSLQLGGGGLALFVALLLGLSGLLHRWVELPAQRWLNARCPGTPARAFAPA